MGAVLPAVKTALDAVGQLFAPQRQFLIHNATDRPIELGYDGETFVIPAHNEIVEPIPTALDKFASGQDAAGNYIPGTLLIQDKIGNRNANADLLGNNARGDRWDSAAAVRHSLGVTENDRKPSSAWYRKGISLLPNNPTPDVVTQTQIEGRKRFEKFRLETDRDMVNTFRERAGKHRALGLHPDAPPPEFFEAEARLQNAAKAGVIPVVSELPIEAVMDKANLAKNLLNDVEFMQALKLELLSKEPAKKGK